MDASSPQRLSPTINIVDASAELDEIDPPTETEHEKIVRWMSFRRHTYHLYTELEAGGWHLAALVCAAKPGGANLDPESHSLKILFERCVADALVSDGDGGVGGDGGVAGATSDVSAVAFAMTRAMHSRVIGILELGPVLSNPAYGSQLYHDILARVGAIGRLGDQPAAGETLDWIAYCGRNPDPGVCRIIRILDALELGELDPAIALAFCLDCIPHEFDIDDTAKTVADAITKAIDAADKSTRLQLPPVIV